MRQSTQSSVEYFNAKAYQVGIVAAQFNSAITDQMVALAQDELGKFSVPANQQRLVRVPGSVELPLALQLLAQSGQYDCLVALGCVIQGETKHFDYVCQIAADGIRQVMLQFSIPIGFGLLTTVDQEQALARLDFARAAVRASLELARLAGELKIKN